jgi:hypothetical protein
MRASLAIVVVFAVVVLSASPVGTQRAFAEGAVFDRVVAVVDDRVITLSKLEFEAQVWIIDTGGNPETIGLQNGEVLASASQDERLEQESVQRLGEQLGLRLGVAACGPLPNDMLKKTLGVLIGQKLAEAEAEKLKVYEVEPAEVDKRVQEFSLRLDLLKQGPLSAFLARNEAPPGELRAIFQRYLRYARYVEGQVRLARVSDVELERYLQEHASELGPEASNEMREAVRNRLKAERSKQVQMTELRRLRSRARVRIVDPEFAGADAILQPSASAEVGE